MNMIRLLTILMIGACFTSCKNDNQHNRTVYRDTSITAKTSYNNLFFDSLQLAIFLKEHSKFNAYEQQYTTFYKERNYQFAWFDKNGVAEQTQHFINLINTAIVDLKDSSLYNKQLFQLYEKAANDSLHQLNNADILQTELFFTGQFFTYAANAYKGSNINAADLGWFIPRKKLDFAVLLDSILKSKSANLEGFAVPNTRYKKLQEQLGFYYELAKKPWGNPIPKLQKPLKKGDSSLVILQIKKQLSELGDLPKNDGLTLYDSVLYQAVVHFQNRMGLSADGAIGNKMIEELNIPVQQRIRQMLVNLERLRWMPPIKNTNFILVNIPEYRLHLYDSGINIMNMNVIVGKAANGTVIFKSDLKYVVFSPYWNVPNSIVRKELLPAMSKNSNYLQKHNMEITGTNNGLPSIRQKPGPDNALGLVKFLFPNNYDIYLHDTPNRDLFSQSTRGLSHGCIRISEPKKMAEYLLRDDTAWNTTTIDEAMHLAKEKWVTLKKTVPVYIVYFTAWVDNTGTLNFRKDIYGHDQKMAAKLFAN